MFQFHTGSIKREGGYSPFSDEVCFNSILVRLKVLVDHTQEIEIPMFQFHTGSIKRALKVPEIMIEGVSFNSILVRLKAEDLHSNDLKSL